MGMNWGSRLEDGALHEKAHATWSRRQFLRNIALSGAAVTLGLNGRTVRASQTHPLVDALTRSASDRILVVIQLAGGNDGLNTIVPIANDVYYNARPNLAVPARNAIQLDPETGLHPILQSIEPLYQEGVLQVIQNVGYASPELSHFTSTDVWLSGQNTAALDNTGWSGRFLEHAYPTYADNPPDHPIALQIGSSTPLLFAGYGQSLGVTFPNQSLLDRLSESGKLFDEGAVPDTIQGDEIAFVRRMSNDAFGYARAIKEAHDAGSNEASYSGGDSLGRDLATVARLIRGGLGARIYHVSLGGFDTHAYQGSPHQRLLRRLGASISGFVQDLQADGLLERVCGVTFSEFGRRVYENGSQGTDHGTAAPMFMFGQALQGGLIGTAPDLVNLDPARNLVAGIDFRSVYGGLLRDWFGMEQGAVDQVFNGAYPVLNLFNGSISTSNQETATLPQRVTLDSVYPNPMHREARVAFTLHEPGPVKVSLVDLLGREVTAHDMSILQQGSHEVLFAIPKSVAAGTYILRLQHKSASLVRTVQVMR